MNEFNTSEDVMDEAFEVFSTMELLAMGYISEPDMEELMEPMQTAEMAA